MLKTALMATALSAVLLVPAYAQSPAPADNAGKSQTETTTTMPDSTRAALKGDFVRGEMQSDWRSSQLVGAAVYGPEDKSIGDINDVLIDNSGAVRAVVIGVGGFLGVGEKNVAIPFDALKITRKQNGIDKVWVNYTKEELEKAPKFAYYKAPNEPQTTGAGAYDKIKSKLNDVKEDVKAKVDSMKENMNESKEMNEKK